MEYVIELVIYAKIGVWIQVLAFPAIKIIFYQVTLVFYLSKFKVFKVFRSKQQMNLPLRL